MSATVTSIIGRRRTATVEARPYADFGSCPDCLEHDGVIHETLRYLNVGRAHYGYCESHGTYWPVGEGLFSSWEDETEEHWQRNEQRLAGWRLVAAVTEAPAA